MRHAFKTVFNVLIVADLGPYESFTCTYAVQLAFARVLLQGKFI